MIITKFLGRNISLTYIREYRHLQVFMDQIINFTQPNKKTNSLKYKDLAFLTLAHPTGLEIPCSIQLRYKSILYPTSGSIIYT